jgi:hypothetical protein
VYTAYNNTITPAGAPFYLDSVSQGRVAFISGDKFGLVATDRGMASIFSLDDAANAVPTNADYRPKNCYADSVVADSADTSKACILDINTSGGGIYAVSMGAAGTVTDLGSILSILSAAQLLFPPPAGHPQYRCFRGQSNRRCDLSGLVNSAPLLRHLHYQRL